eukprot:COSAG01_NODE_915_length_12761_cov_33.161507_13_plen_150_part_00
MRMPTLGGFFRLKPVSEVSPPASQWPLVAPANPTPRRGGAKRRWLKRRWVKRRWVKRRWVKKALGRRGWSGRLSPDQTPSTCLCVCGLLGWVGGTTHRRQLCTAATQLDVAWRAGHAAQARQQALQAHGEPAMRASDTQVFLDKNRRSD